jgi:Ca2+-binding RTX toxin-like protein
MMNNTYSIGNNLLVKANSMVEQNLLLTLEQAVLRAQEQLQVFASDSEFGQKIELAFGSGVNAEELRKAWQAGDFSQLPRIEIRSAKEINGANGAFAKATNTVYLSQQYLSQNVGNSEAVTRVLLEEIGHFVDSKINITDTPGDEGQIFSATVSNQNLTPEQLQVIRSEDDTSFINLDAKVIQIEQSTVPNQVLWSDRVGTDLSGSWGFGNLLGIPNEKTYSKFFGLDLNNSPKSFSIPVPGIDLGVVGANADVSLGIAGSKNESSNYKLKAGLQIDAGYNFGGVNFAFPMFTDIQYGINNDRLNFQVNNNRKFPSLDWIDPRVFFKVSGLIQSDAAIYLKGKFNGEYVNPFKSVKSLFSEGKLTKSTTSIDFDKKLNLSTKWSHNFINFDTQNKSQVVDWIFGRKEFKIGGLEQDKIDVGTLFNLGLGLPDFSKVAFKPVAVSDPNLYKYSLSGKSTLFSLDFDIDDLIGSKLPIPVTYKGKESFDLFGKEVGYNYNFALFDINLVPSLDLNYSIDLDIKDILPTIKIEDVNGGWRAFNYSELNRPVGDLSTNQNTINYLDTLDKDGDGKIEFQTSFEPNLSVKLKAWLQPKITLKTGIGAYNLGITPFESKSFGGYVFDTPDPAISLPSVSLFDETLATLSFKNFASKLGLNASLLDPKLSSISLNPIKKALGFNVVDLGSGPDYYPGTNGNDDVDFNEGSDVGQVSPGLDGLDGGTEGSPIPANSLSYKDAFDQDLLNNKNIPNGDIFILDSDIYSLTKGDVRLFAGTDAKGGFFELDIDGRSGRTNGPDTQLRDFERLILSDELKANSQGIKLNLASLDDFGNSKPRLYLGGVPKREAYSPAAPLSTHHLTTTKGSDYLAVPVGYNDVPYILGKGDDVVDFYPNGSALTAQVNPWPYTPGTSPNRSLTTRDWLTPYNYDEVTKLSLDAYQDIIDLGGGNNKVTLTNISKNSPGTNSRAAYDAFITSVNLGGTNEILGDLSDTNHTLRLVNLGGAVNLNVTPSGSGKVEGVFSGGGNKINFAVGETGPYFQAESGLTFVLDSQGLQQKFAIPEIPEVEVELLGSQIFYRTASPDAAGNTLTLQDNLDPDTPLQRITIASADIGGSSIQKELGSEERYSLQSPSKQTYIVGKVSTNPNQFGGDFYRYISLRGKLNSQKGSYRKVVLKNELNNAVQLDDLIDEVVLEGASALKFFSPNSRADYGKLDLSKVDFNSLTNPLGSYSNGWFDSLISGSTSKNYVHEIVYSDNADRISNSTENSYSPSVLTGSFLNSSFAKYAPLVTHKLGGGDDSINGNQSAYEFFYLGAGNNTVTNPDYTNDVKLYNIVNLNAYQPGTGDTALGKATSVYQYQFNDSNISLPVPKPPFGDVVVYTEGSRSDYVIQRSQTKPNAIEVIKKDGTKDTLFGVSLIKFETEDVSTIPVADSITSPGEVTRIDLFGNDLKSRLFYSHVARPDGESFDIQLDNKWAVDRVDVTQEVIYQPGQILQQTDVSADWSFSETKTSPVNPKNYWEYNIPINISPNGFTVTKDFLLKEFSDPDISVKGLYTANKLTISALKVTQKVIQANQTIDVAIPVETLDDRWLIKSTNPITLDSFPFEISYIITEPEGYSHLVRLNLNPSEIVSLQDLRTIFQAGISNNEFNGSSGNDNIDGSDEAETIRGNGGQNIIYGGAGDDRLFGGDDSDFISGDPGSDTIEGGSGDDIIDGDSTLAQNIAPALGTETSTSTSVSANDVINGGFGDDIILGGIGDDRLIPGKGNDLIEGGEGTDTGVSSGTSTDYRIRKRLDASILVIDERTTDNEGIELYLDTEKFEFSDRTFTIDEVQTSSVGAATFNEDKTQVTIQTSEQNLELKTVEGSKIVSIDIPSLEDLIVDKVLLAKSLAVLEKYRNTKGEKFNTSSSVLEFLVQTPDTSPKEVIEFKLAQEQDADTFIKIKPSSGETFEFNYNPATGTGAELIDSNSNGLVDLVKIHVKDGDVGDADGEVNGVIYDPGMLAKRTSNSGDTGNPPSTTPTPTPEPTPTPTPEPTPTPTPEPTPTPTPTPETTPTPTPTPEITPTPTPEPTPTIEENNRGDTLIGTNRSDLIIGRQGNDVLIGKLKNDSLFGGLGNDLLYGNQGKDIINGNQGNDTVHGGKGNDVVRGGKNNDLILGNLGEDKLFGNLGNDTVYGGKGNDVVRGGKNDDLILGNLGDDKLFGNLGNDTLIGGQGNDSLTGGAGNDLFVLGPATGVDALADFQLGQDKLGLSGGLRFEQLAIAQGTGISARDTFVRIAANQELLTILSNVPASSITDAAFAIMET